MTVETSTSRVQYATNGTTGPWSVPFYFLADADLRVVYANAAGAETELVLTTDYSVTGAANPAGGSVTTVASYASGGTVTVLRSVAVLQPTDYTDTDAFPAETLERNLDRLTMLDQQALEVLGRAMVFAVSDTASAQLPSASARANKILAFDTDGAPTFIDFTAAGTLGNLPRPENYFVTGDPDDTLSFQRALAANSKVFGTPGRIYQLANLEIDSRQFEGNGCVIQPASGARWVIKLKGYQPAASGFVLQDSDEYRRATTLSSGALISATALVATSATGIEAGQVLLNEVDAAALWHLTEVSSVAGSTVNIRDAIPSAASSGSSLVAMFGAIWVEDALWWKIDDVHVVNARGALLIKPSSSGLSNYGSLSRFSCDGIRYFGIVKQSNAAGVKLNDAKLWGGYVVTTNATGNGTAGPFTFSTDVNAFLKRDLSVTVGGVTKTTPTHWTYATGKTISFTGGNEPANGAAIVMSHFRDGLRCFVDDQRSTSVISGGNHYSQLECLDGFVGVELRNVELTNFSGLIADTCSFAGVLVDSSCASSLSIDQAFIGYSRSSLKVYVSSFPIIGRLYTNRVGASDLVDGTQDHNIEIDATSELSLDASQWDGGDYQVSGSGAINWRGGRHLNFYSTLGSSVAAGSTVYMNLGSHTVGVPTTAQLLAADTNLLELIVQSGAAPGAAQTYTYQWNINGADVGTAVTISGAAAFGNTLRLTTTAAKGDRVCIKLITSAGAAGAEHRAIGVVR